MSSSKILLALGLVCTVLHISESAKPCQIPWGPTLPNWFPLIWNNSDITYPKWNGSAWAISLYPKTSVQLGCGDLLNSLASYALPEITLTCDGYGRLKVADIINVNFTKLGCLDQVKEQVVKTGQCYNGYDSVDITFTSTLKNFSLITVCHNTDIDNSISASHTIHGASLNRFEVSNKRPSFKEGGYYTKIGADDSYGQKSQLAIVTQLVGPIKGPQYIDVARSFYFARGHLAPDGDFVHIYEQNATYYFINVIPQWQIINNGNWKAMEMALRDYATSHLIDLKVWTGGNGVLTLKSDSGEDVEIYLAKDSSGKRRLPAPMLSWKVVQDPASNKAVAIFMVNNPHLESIPSNLLLCPDVCSQLPWVTWDTSNIQKGYTFCCDMNFVQSNAILPMVPSLGENLSLLS